uniref:Acyl-CoA dehydrogenase n=1 Tax=Timema poppense TaxID=170557 RepID=A0A7R9CTA2_TIMPO|nr:unnamed protein product [Timema poppensis]
MSKLGRSEHQVLLHQGKVAPLLDLGRFEVSQVTRLCKPVYPEDQGDLPQWTSKFPEEVLYTQTPYSLARLDCYDCPLPNVISDRLQVLIRPVFEAIKIKSPSRPKLTKIKKPPFAKSLFAGEIDPDVMTYPEVLDEDTLKALNERLLTLEDFFAKQVDSAAIDSAGCIPPDILEGLKQLDLFGQQIPVEYGGLGLTVTEFARLSEVLASDPSIFLLLAAHQLLGLQGLLIAGTEEQKYRYLPRLANGDWVAALCLSESESGSDLTSIKTQATLSEDGDTWVINGSKNWVTNGNIANLYIVFAKTKMEDHKGQIHDRTTAFLVEREFEGVSCGQPDDKLGVRGTSTCERNTDLALILLRLGKEKHGFGTSTAASRKRGTQIWHFYCCFWAKRNTDLTLLMLLLGKEEHRFDTSTAGSGERGTQIWHFYCCFRAKRNTDWALLLFLGKEEHRFGTSPAASGQKETQI